jgi:hypothetical protein
MLPIISDEVPFVQRWIFAAEFLSLENLTGRVLLRN